jgi:serine protease Do
VKAVDHGGGFVSIWLTSAARATLLRGARCAVALWALAGLVPHSVSAQGLPASPRANLDRPIGWLGITIQEVTEELAERLAARFGVAAGIGVLVVEAMPGGPAAAAGLQRGDVIVAMDGQPIWEVRQLQRRVRAAPLGASASIVVLREGGRVQVPVQVGPMPEETMAVVLGEALGFAVQARPQEGAPGATRRPRLEGRPAVPGGGLPSEGPVIVVEVAPRSPAAAAGLQQYDMVVEVDGRPVAGLMDLYGALRGAAAKRAFPLVVDRKGTRLVLTLAPGAAPPSP